MSTKASVVIQDLTYTERFLAEGVTISYTSGGTAGSEVVTVSNSAITVQIGASTATQIKAAIDGNEFSTKLVSVAISGTAGTVQKTCKSVSFSGGRAVGKSTTTFGSITLTSVANGGTAIRFKFTTGATAGSEVITVATNDITCQIAEGVSTYAQVKTAIDGDSGAHALVLVASNGVSLGNAAYLTHCPAFRTLTGGASAATAATAINQDLTFTTVATGTAANATTVTYTTGAVAGSEVVTEVGSAVNVQISNGVSTATQIKAALDGAALLITTAISGTGATAQKTVNGAATTGAVGDGAPDYYNDGSTTALTASYVAFPFGFVANNGKLVNDETSGAKGITYSFDGINVHGTLLFGKEISWQDFGLSCIWLKNISAAPAYRLMVQGK